MGFDKVDAYLAITENRRRIERLETVVAQLIQDKQQPQKKTKKTRKEEKEHITEVKHENRRTIQNIAEGKSKISRV